MFNDEIQFIRKLSINETETVNAIWLSLVTYKVGSINS